MARRGARVGVLLDSFFGNAEAGRSHQATVEYLNGLAASEGLDLQVRVDNLTGGSIHMKLVLVKVGDEMWTALEPQRRRDQPQGQPRGDADGGEACVLDGARGFDALADA